MTKITKKNFKKALQGSEGNFTVIAQRLNVSRRAAYKFVEKNPEFKQDIEEELDKKYDIAEAQMSVLAKERDYKALRTLLLETKRGRARGYGNFIQTEQVGGLDIKKRILEAETFKKLPEKLKNEIVDSL